MVNQQLADYINEQVRVGVSKDAIKGALLEAGWAQNEVMEAMGGGTRVDAVAPVTATAAKPAMTQAQQRPAVQNFSAEVAAAKPMANVGGVGPSSAKPTVTVRTVGPSQQPMSMNTASTAPATVAAANPGHHMHINGHRIIDIVMGVLILILGGASTMLFIKNSSLAKELGLAESEKGTVAIQLSTAASQNDTLEKENDELRAEKKVFEAELAIVASNRASGEEQIEVKGTLIAPADNKAPYTLRTAHNIIVSLKNSRVANIDAALLPNVGTEVKILALHQVGSKDLTVLTLNGTSVQPSSSSSTP